MTTPDTINPCALMLSSNLELHHPPAGTLLAPRGPGRCCRVVQGLEHCSSQERQKLTQRKLHLHTVGTDQQRSVTHTHTELLKVFYLSYSWQESRSAKGTAFQIHPSSCCFHSHGSRGCFPTTGEISAEVQSTLLPLPLWWICVTRWQSIKTSSSDSAVVSKHITYHSNLSFPRNRATLHAPGSIWPGALFGLTNSWSDSAAGNTQTKGSLHCKGYGSARAAAFPNPRNSFKRDFRLHLCTLPPTETTPLFPFVPFAEENLAFIRARAQLRSGSEPYQKYQVSLCGEGVGGCSSGSNKPSDELSCQELHHKLRNPHFTKT